jgi:hypothetical protein
MHLRAKNVKGASKFLAALIAFVLTSAIPVIAADSGVPDYSGTWKIETSGAWSAHPLCLLQQAGNRITGTCKGGSNIGTLEGIGTSSITN